MRKLIDEGQHNVTFVLLRMIVPYCILSLYMWLKYSYLTCFNYNCYVTSESECELTVRDTYVISTLKMNIIRYGFSLFVIVNGGR